MNYLKQLNAFYSYLESEILTSNEIALYQGLLFSNNKSGWVSTFRVSNNVLLSRTGLNKTSLNRARNRLIQLQLVTFEKGKNRFNAGIYSIKQLYFDDVEFQNESLNGTLEVENCVACQYETVNDTISGTVNDTVTEPTAEPLLNININKTNDEIYILPKLSYSEYVRLTEAEYQKLESEYTKELTDEFILRLNDYIGQVGSVEASKKYRDHFYTLKNWMNRHLKATKVYSQEKVQTSKKNNFSDYTQRATDYEKISEEILQRRINGQKEGLRVV